MRISKAHHIIFRIRECLTTGRLIHNQYPHSQHHNYTRGHAFFFFFFHPIQLPVHIHHGLCHTAPSTFRFITIIISIMYSTCIHISPQRLYFIYSFYPSIHHHNLPHLSPLQPVGPFPPFRIPFKQHQHPRIHQSFLSTLDICWIIDCRPKSIIEIPVGQHLIRGLLPSVLFQTPQRQRQPGHIIYLNAH
eukprot:jgi/Picsp_1/2068/NSC_05533-R1_---NA---